MVPSIQIHIQDYKDELNANVLALDKYDMVLSMAWLNTYDPTVDYRAKSLSFAHDGKTITLKPMPIDADVHTQVPSVKPEAILNSVADDDTSLITDDQQLIVREGVRGAQSPHHYSTVNTVLYIVLLVVLLAVYLGYTCAEKIAVSRVGISTNETQIYTPSTISRLLHPMSYFSSPQTIMSIWLCIYPLIHIFTTKRTPDHPTIDSSGYEHIQGKAKKARPR